MQVFLLSPIRATCLAHLNFLNLHVINTVNLLHQPDALFNIYV
jgi:hypothetical protein